MNIIEKIDSKRYYVITNTDNSLIIFGKLDDDCTLGTGQPNLFSFLTEDEMVLKLNEITGSDEYYLNSEYYKENHS